MEIVKKIINGKKYDTTTARLIASWSNGYYLGDFDFCEEFLYRKRNGEFFIHGHGGARSSYSRTIGHNTWTGGEDIRPIDIEDAKRLIEEYCDVEVYESEFGEVGE